MAKAETSKGGRLAVVLTGVAGHAAALLGALEGLEEAGLKPDLVVGASGGALAGALYCATGSAEAARVAYYQAVSSNSWQQLADVDFATLLNAKDRPHDVSGLLVGEALFQALRATPLGNKGFQHLSLPLFVVTADLNSGQALVFGNALRPEGEQRSYLLYARSQADLDRVNVASATRASLSTPGLFEPVSLDYYCLTDGSLRARQALSVAAEQEGVERIIWLHAGLEPADAFSLVSDYAHQGVAARLLAALTVGMADTFDAHSADPALAGKAVRFVNLSVSSVSAADTVRTQSLYESGRRSVASLAQAAGSGAELAGGDPAQLATTLEGIEDEQNGRRYRVTVGSGNSLAIIDSAPTVATEFGYELDEYLAGAKRDKLTAKEPLGAALFTREATAEQAGLWTLAGYYLWYGCGYVCRALVAALSVAFDAIGLDSLWDSAKKGVAKGAESIASTLRSAPSPDEPEAAAGAQSVVAPAPPLEIVGAEPSPRTNQNVVPADPVVEPLPAPLEIAGAEPAPKAAAEPPADDTA